MGTSRGWVAVHQRVGVACLLLILLGAGTAHADDLPGVVADSVYRAEAQLAEHPGDAAVAEAIVTELTPHAAKAVHAPRFWKAFQAAWTAAGRSEEALWESVVAPLQAAHPTVPTFDLLRASLATDPAERMTYVKAAVAKDPAGVPARLMLARLHVELGNLDEADELLDALMKDAPDERGVLLAKGEIFVRDGMGKSAIRVADKALETWGDDPSLFDLKARAARVLARNDSLQWTIARDAATRAVALEGAPAYVETLVDILKAMGQRDEALRVLDEQFRASGSLVLGAMLGADAFEQGDYLTAIRTLAPAKDRRLVYAKAYAVALARTAQTDAAVAAIDQVLAKDPAWEAAPTVRFLAGDAEGALPSAPMEPREPEQRLRAARPLAWLGRADAVQKAVGDLLRDKSRQSEEALLHLLTARVLEALGPQAQALRDQVIHLRGKIAKRPRKRAKEADTIAGGAATFETYAMRAVSYFRTPDGAPYVSVGQVSRAGGFIRFGPNRSFRVTMSDAHWTLEARSTVDTDHTVTFRFNEREGEEPTKASKVIVLEPNKEKPDDDDAGDDKKDGAAKPRPKTFADAVDALDRATLAVLRRAYPEAVSAFDDVLSIEPHWARVAVLRAAARALGGGEPERAMAGREARRIHEAYPDDLISRELAVFLDAWGGVDPEEDIREIEKRRATRNQRDIKKL